MNLVDQFEVAARDAGATVERIPLSSDELAAAVLRAEPGASRIAIANPLDLPPELFEACRKLPGVVKERSKRGLASCDVGITDAFAAVARTGSVCVCIDNDDSGYISLLARAHVVVVAAADMVERPGDLMRSDRLDGKGLRRNFVFITGPSATADMGPLVRGVHGPHRLHIVVVA